MTESQESLGEAPFQAASPPDTKEPSPNTDDKEIWAKYTGAGFSKENLLQYADAQKKSPIVSAISGGTLLGAMFLGASPIIQMQRAAVGHGANPTWESFKGNAPKAAALGFALGAIGNGLMTVFRNANLDKENRAAALYVDQLEAQRAAISAAPPERG